VQPAGGFGVCDVLGYGGGEGDDVVADLGFDLVDAGDGEVAAVADGVGGGLRDQAEAGESLGGAVSTASQQRYLFRRTRCGPWRACVASDHLVVSSQWSVVS